MAVPIAVFHPGTQHSWQTSIALQQMGRLAFYATSIFYQPDRWPYRLERYLPGSLGQRLHAEFRRFSHPALDPAMVRTSGMAEWLERVAARAGFRRLAHRIDTIGNRRFGAALSATIHSPETFALWGFDSSSADAFRAGKAAGRTLILDRTIGDWRAYNLQMDAVFDGYPEFFANPNYRVSNEKIERDEAEYALADHILTGSPFAAQTLIDHSSNRDVAAKINVLNYCYDETMFSNQPAPVPVAKDQPLRFLFLGQAGPRKGIHLVLNAFARIPATAAQLTIVGDLQVPREVFARYADRVTYRPTVARADVPALMRQADILLFPSYFEGSALSLLEALASGLAIIQSPNAGVGVTDRTGILLPELSEQAVFDAVMSAVENRTLVDSWRSAAQVEASRYSFANYRNNIAGLLERLRI